MHNLASILCIVDIMVHSKYVLYTGVAIPFTSYYAYYAYCTAGPKGTAAVLNLFPPVAKPYIPNVGFTQLGIPTSQMQFTLYYHRLKPLPTRSIYRDHSREHQPQQNNHERRRGDAQDGGDSERGGYSERGGQGGVDGHLRAGGESEASGRNRAFDY